MEAILLIIGVVFVMWTNETLFSEPPEEAPEASSKEAKLAEALKDFLENQPQN